MKEKLIVVVGLVLVTLVFFGCTTSVPLVVQKPAEVNMVGARRIAIMDFGYPVQGTVYVSFADLFKAALLRAYNLPRNAARTVEQRIAQYTTDRLIITLLDTNYFEIISPRHLAAALPSEIDSRMSAVQVGNRVKAEAIIVGDITEMGARDETVKETYTKKDEKTGKPITRIRRFLERTVTLALDYRVVNVKTGAIMATKYLSGTKKDRKPLGDDSIKPAVVLYQEIVDDLLPVISKQLAPYEVTEYRYLLNDETEDPRMEMADEFVKAGAYDAALELFLEVWDDEENPAAGFNAAIMHEAVGEIERAIEQMARTLKMIAGAQARVQRRVSNEHNRLLRTKEEMERVSEQLPSADGNP
ncbi:MAG: hypothetical protein CMN78_03850 [Spirochaetales bacterium]|nr:hypothetical protein [Spirochaetales bacterium]